MKNSDQLNYIEKKYSYELLLCNTKEEFRIKHNEINLFCRWGEYTPELGAWNQSLEWIQIKLFKIYLDKFELTPREEYTKYVFLILKPFFQIKLWENYLFRYILNNGKVGINTLSLEAFSYLKNQVKSKSELDLKIFLFFFKSHYPLTELLISNLDVFLKILKKNLPEFKIKYRAPLITHYLLEYKDEDYCAPKIELYEHNKYFYYLFLREKLKDCLRESENQLREELGYKRIGEGYVQEHTLYKELTKVVDPSKIKRRFRPKWLGGLELDFYFEHEDKKIGIEYQGAQHVKPIKHFGGKKAFKRQISRDKRKLNTCYSNGVKLIYCYFDDSIEKFVKNLSYQHGIFGMKHSHDSLNHRKIKEHPC